MRKRDGVRVHHEKERWGETSPSMRLRAQVDILFLTETLLKPDIPDVLYAVPGFSIYRHERVSRCGGGVLVFVNDQLKLKRQDDLENLDLEVIWLEVFPIKSKRSLFLESIVHPGIL